MPKFIQPNTLEDLAIETLVTMVWRSSQVINITGLQDYLYADLPRVLWNKLSTHMLSNAAQRFTYDDDHGGTNENYLVILAIICKHISILDLTYLPIDAQMTIISNISCFDKLRTLIVSTAYQADVVETPPIVLGELQLLVNFQMHWQCSDAIIIALESCSRTIEHIDVEGSVEVTNASFEVLKKCPKLKHVLICGTSMKARGFDRFLQSKKSDDTANGLLHLSVGSRKTWAVSSRQLNKIASACPMLKLLEIYELRGDMENLVSLTALEVLRVHIFDFQECNLDGFLHSRGSNLLSLELTHAKNSDVDLMCIMEHCANIEELFVNDCDIMDLKWSNVEKAAKAFENLEVLDLFCGFPPSSIERMLYACVNLTFLRLDANKEGINDEFIVRLLSRNPLQKLRAFFVDFGDLSMTSVNALIQQCPLLEELYYLDEWSGVTDTEVQTLIQNIEDMNLNLWLYPETYKHYC